MAVKTGVTSWADPELTRLGWYPPGVRSAEEKLRHYATQFPLVENDMTYWALPERRLAELWSARTPPGFTMNVKAFASFTGHYTDPRRLSPDLRDALPPELLARGRVYPRHLGPSLLEELERRFLDALAPLEESGRLGVILFQYPVWFPRSRENQAELARLPDHFAPHRLAVEFRNATWMTRDHDRRETLALLRAHGLAYTCVDEPQGFVSSVPPVAAATAPIALVRLHGRNANRWARATRSAADRFDYLYTPAELAGWVAPIERLASDAGEVHVLFNNCHRDYAVTNARQMVELMATALRERRYPI
jgi:uncharacterized protein YecE (DUF72 family)